MFAPGRRRFVVRSSVIAGLILAALPAQPAHAQTDYFNTDSGRPLTVEDAYPTERFGLELQVAPLKVERGRGGVYRWTAEPEASYGILPRTHVEIGLPVTYTDARASKPGVAGVELAVLHNLNTETSLPAFAFAADVVFPVGSHSPDQPRVSIKGIATKSFSFARFHVNGQAWIAGNEPQLGLDDDLAGEEGFPSWLAGLSVDKPYPLRSLLIGAEVFARRSEINSEDVEWNAAAGMRKQLTPAFNMDIGIGRKLTGTGREWFVTLGLSRMFALIP
jgi:hypothetical protein